MNAAERERVCVSACVCVCVCVLDGEGNRVFASRVLAVVLVEGERADIFFFFSLTSLIFSFNYLP